MSLNLKYAPIAGAVSGLAFFLHGAYHRKPNLPAASATIALTGGLIGLTFFGAHQAFISLYRAQQTNTKTARNTRIWREPYISPNTSSRASRAKPRQKFKLVRCQVTQDSRQCNKRGTSRRDIQSSPTYVYYIAHIIIHQCIY